MYPVSDQFRAALAGQHQFTAKLDILDQDGRVDQTIDILTGALDIDATSAVRRHGSVTVEGARDELDPYSTEVALRAGLVYPDGAEELVPLGVFGVSDPVQPDQGGGITTQCDLFDRAKSVSKRRLPQPYPIPAGGNLGVVIQDLLLSRRPDLVFDFVTTTATAPAGVLEELADPWDKVLQMARSAGMDLLFDTVGRCVMRPVVTLDDAQVAWSYIEGTGQGMTKITKRRSTEQTYSHAIVTGETTYAAPVVRADAYDEDEDSLTYWRGPFGDQPTKLSSPYITTQEQADTAAKALLARSAGLSEGLELSAVPNPALDVDDLVLVVRGALAVNDIYALQTINLPFSVDGEMRATTRTRRRISA